MRKNKIMAYVTVKLPGQSAYTMLTPDEYNQYLKNPSFKMDAEMGRSYTSVPAGTPHRYYPGDSGTNPAFNTPPPPPPPVYKNPVAPPGSSQVNASLNTTTINGNIPTNPDSDGPTIKDWLKKNWWWVLLALGGLGGLLLITYSVV